MNILSKILKDRSRNYPPRKTVLNVSLTTGVFSSFACLDFAPGPIPTLFNCDARRRATWRICSGVPAAAIGVYVEEK